MRLGAADHRPPAGIRTPGLAIAPPCGIPRRHQRREVADRAALHEDAAGALRQAELRGQPVEHLVLGVDGTRALHPRSAVDGGCRHHEVERDRRLRRGGRDERHVAGVVRRDARGREHVLEEGCRAARADARSSDRARGEARELPRREGLVERDVLPHSAPARVVEDFVDGRPGLVRDGVHPIRLHGCPSLTSLHARGAE